MTNLPDEAAGNAVIERHCLLSSHYQKGLVEPSLIINLLALLTP